MLKLVLFFFILYYYYGTAYWRILLSYILDSSILSYLLLSFTFTSNRWIVILILIYLEYSLLHCMYYCITALEFIIIRSKMLVCKHAPKGGGGGAFVTHQHNRLD